jgi:hypothetical protein
MARFYNPGERIKQTLSFTNTTKSKAVSNISYHILEAPARAFFEIPAHADVMDGEGNEVEIPTSFPKDVKRLFAKQGVILIDPKPRNPIIEEDNIALNDDDAVQKGDAMYQNYLRHLVDEHFQNVHRAESAGTRPQPAQFQHKFALRALKIKDPADSIGNLIEAEAGKTTTAAADAKVAALEAALAEQKGQMAAFMALLPQLAQNNTTPTKNGK